MAVRITVGDDESEWVEIQKIPKGTVFRLSTGLVVKTNSPNLGSYMKLEGQGAFETSWAAPAYMIGKSAIEGEMKVEAMR